MRVLINRTDAIGDTILTMPMAKIIKENHPNAKIAFIISPKSKDLFLHHPYIDECWVLDHSNNLFSKISHMLKLFTEFKPDTFFHVGGSYIPTFFAWFKRVPFRGGLKSKWKSFLFLNKGIRQSRSIVAMHESDYNLNLLRPLGIEYHYSHRDKYRPIIQLKFDEVQSSFKFFEDDLKQAGIKNNKSIVMIHPGMVGHTLNWSSRNYARLVSRIENANPDKFLFVISHTPVDEPYLIGFRDFFEQEENKKFKESIYYFNGINRGLRDYMGILSKAECFIGPSTGTTHIANALGVKQIGLYSPIKVQSALRWSPFYRGSGVEILVPEVVCGEQFKCSERECPYYECMAKVEVEDVYHSFNNLIKKPN